VWCCSDRERKEYDEIVNSRIVVSWSVVAPHNDNNQTRRDEARRLEAIRPPPDSPCNFSIAIDTSFITPSHVLSVRSCDVTHSGNSDPKIRADNLLSFAADSSYFQLTQQQTWW
jgi:hypothetical protein